MAAIGVTLPGINIGLPSFNMGSSASAGLSQDGAFFDFGQGDWNVNVAGSGYAAQGTGLTVTTALMIAAGGLLVWYLLK